jgi:hypothetical protein
MIRGFGSVAWVAAVGGAALGCYILSLQVATERSDLAKVEARIIAAKQQIRSLQTELGTRGRLSQLEQWNTDVLALSAPASGQFLQDEFTLARLSTHEQTVDEKEQVRLASAESDGAAAPVQDPKIVRSASAPAPAAEPVQPAIVHRASFTAPDPRASADANPKASRRLDPRLADELGAAARREKPRTDTGRAEGVGTDAIRAAATTSGRTAPAVTAGKRIGAPATTSGKRTEVARAEPIPAPSAPAAARPDRRRSDAGRGATPRPAGARSEPARTDTSRAGSTAGGAGTR